MADGVCSLSDKIELRTFREQGRARDGATVIGWCLAPVPGVILAVPLAAARIIGLLLLAAGVFLVVRR